MGLINVIVYLCACAYAFVVLDLVSSVLCQEIGWEEHLRNDLLCIEWDVKPQLSQSIQYWWIRPLHMTQSDYLPGKSGKLENCKRIREMSGKHTGCMHDCLGL